MSAASTSSKFTESKFCNGIKSSIFSVRPNIRCFLLSLVLALKLINFRFFTFVSRLYVAFSAVPIELKGLSTMSLDPITAGVVTITDDWMATLSYVSQNPPLDGQSLASVSPMNEVSSIQIEPCVVSSALIYIAIPLALSANLLLLKMNFFEAKRPQIPSLTFL